MSSPFREPAKTEPPFRGKLEGREWEYVGEGWFYGPEGHAIRRVEALRAGERFLVRVSEMVREPAPMPRPIGWSRHAFPGPPTCRTPPLPAPKTYIFEMTASSLAEIQRVFFRKVEAPKDRSANEEESG